MLDSKFLVLCASCMGEESYSAVGVGSLATRYWAMGTGWDPLQNRMISPMADTNTNGKNYFRGTVSILLSSSP